MQTINEKQLAAAFDLVNPRTTTQRLAARQGVQLAEKDLPHWKDRISALVSQADLDAAGVTIEKVAEAVEHFTATRAKCEPAQLATDAGPVPGYYVTAAGYWMGPAGVR